MQYEPCCGILFVVSEIWWIGLSDCFSLESLTKILFLKRLFQIVPFPTITQEGEARSFSPQMGFSIACYSISYKDV